MKRVLNFGILAFFCARKKNLTLTHFFPFLVMQTFICFRVDYLEDGDDVCASEFVEEYHFNRTNCNFL